jgi:membrane protein DedA with SNARE-associated domain
MVVALSLVASILHLLKTVPPVAVYFIVAFLVFGEAALFIGFFLPAEASVITAGVLAKTGHVHIGLLLVIVIVAAIVGDSTGYFVGERYGERLLSLGPIKKRRGLIDRTIGELQRRGMIYVFIGRFTAFLRAVTPGLAGLSKMHYRRFLIANALGGIAWGGLSAGLGYVLGNVVEKYFARFGYVILGAIVIAVVAHHLHSKRREKRVELAENVTDNHA